MANFINKLNVLVRSSMHSVLGDDTRRRKRRSDLPSLARLGSDIDQEIAALRDQINHALDDEDHMIADLHSLQRQIADWDQQADQALVRGDEATARHAIHQMQLHQQRATMLEAELSQHRMSTSELIHRVNELEALVAEARRRQQETPPQDDHTTGEPLSARLRKGRQAAETQELEAVPVDTAPAEVDERVIDDDLAQRRARLMRKD